MPTVTHSDVLVSDDSYFPSVLPTVSDPVNQSPSPASSLSLPSASASTSLPTSAISVSVSPEPLHRSNRVHKPPTYLSDYHCSQLTSAPSDSMSGSCRYPLSSVLSYGCSTGSTVY
ncbi:hypothetical protein QN277_019909 [Acacia crassicarpa]|uniref:Uncharacterized protein n=1 Tax=Acacia crassicarpa TaxID=499986 RepID=A0AAE1MKI7_9FABA|nr:hypothetical protein QN277_019909 [Acacia crassicarpa]